MLPLHHNPNATTGSTKLLQVWHHTYGFIIIIPLHSLVGLVDHDCRRVSSVFNHTLTAMTA